MFYSLSSFQKYERDETNCRNKRLLLHQRDITSRVPQGSVLRSILFNILISNTRNGETVHIGDKHIIITTEESVKNRS